MSDVEGILRLQPSGRWAVCRPNEPPVEISTGDAFRVEVDGAVDLKLTRMEFWHFGGPLKGREFREGPGEYYSVEGYELRDGLRAAIGWKRPT
jgi:hypothetical protein